MGYAENLRELRGKKSRAIVCRETGIKYSTLTMYENGERNPKDTVKRILADYYGKTVQEIFFDD
ncbi:helix-turn-helix transcriptional regulator [Eubacterium callanderi]|uniref:helix-turn-helix transcriptional regulator n=1 Tax=Eubacterium callanderi TaxID=53442 RepID=UPI001AA144FB|nr:helix-turn-helix transcriptional regulator [Eubacterium callanderi]MBO1701075.1 helix-turn-helix transcriptional regulator [Eubacterium callanderi]